MDKLITIQDDKAILQDGMVNNLIDIENKIKELKKVQDNYKKVIKEAMEQQGIIKVVDEITGLSISYIAEQNNLEKFNKDKFQEENPELYDKYVTMDGKKAAYITVRIK